MTFASEEHEATAQSALIQPLPLRPQQVPMGWDQAAPLTLSSLLLGPIALVSQPSTLLLPIQLEEETILRSPTSSQAQEHPPLQVILPFQGYVELSGMPTLQFKRDPMLLHVVMLNPLESVSILMVTKPSIPQLPLQNMMQQKMLPLVKALVLDTRVSTLTIGKTHAKGIVK